VNAFWIQLVWKIVFFCVLLIVYNFSNNQNRFSVSLTASLWRLTKILQVIVNYCISFYHVNTVCINSYTIYWLLSFKSSKHKKKFENPLTNAKVQISFLRKNFVNRVLVLCILFSEKNCWSLRFYYILRIGTCSLYGYRKT